MQAEAAPLAPGERGAALGRPVLVSTSQAWPACDPIAFFSQAAGGDRRVMWLRPDSREALVGLGAAWTITASGAERFEIVGRAWHDLLADARLDASSEPRLLGGFSFDTTRPTRLWQDFPAARFELPERLLAIHGGDARLTRNTLVGPDGRHSRAADSTSAGPATPGLPSDAWKNLVDEIARGIAHGEVGVEKVVLARARHGQPTRTVEQALRHLAEQYPTCTIFAIAHGDSCFLGATPERLIGLRNGQATTMALAGSAARGATAEEDERIARGLLADHKERSEHAIVLRALREALEPVCASVVADTRPRIRRLSNLQHLLTPVRGQVREGRGVLDLVARLHPTPAVGGFPRERALALIREREGLDRGWYAGPVGWIDRHGEGDFVVALRSALVHRDAERETATLFAGCGIVAESDPATEYAEWGWKLRPMQTALGIL